MDDDLRPLMFSVAYRMVGSVSDAEDLVQDAFLRLHVARSEGVEVEAPKAYLTTVVTRLAIDHLRSARVRREQYVGPWLPEPLVAEAQSDPPERAEMAESLSMAFLVMLERLGPVERAVLLLHDVFDYGYEEIATMVDRSAAGCRQTAVRARRRMEGGPRFEASQEQRNELVRRFIAAFEDGDTDGLVDLLTDDVVFVGDGGGKATGIPHPLHGRDRVGRTLAALAVQFRRRGLSLEQATVNGAPGIIGRDRDGRLINVVSFDVADGAIHTMRSIVNPDKLGHLGPLSDVARRRGRGGT